MGCCSQLPSLCPCLLGRPNCDRPTRQVSSPAGFPGLDASLRSMLNPPASCRRVQQCPHPPLPSLPLNGGARPPVTHALCLQESLGSPSLWTVRRTSSTTSSGSTESPKSGANSRSPQKPRHCRERGSGSLAWEHVCSSVLAWGEGCESDW